MSNADPPRGKCVRIDLTGKMYNQKAKEYFGEYAVLNDIRGDR